MKRLLSKGGYKGNRQGTFGFCVVLMAVFLILLISANPVVAVDSDGDSMDDAWEVTHFMDLSHDGEADTDADGLTDLQEFQNSTDPNDQDSDGDGIDDGDELADGTDPLTDQFASGLLAYYPFSGNANDMSGNGHHGTVSGATLTTDARGNDASAYSFDGTDDYIIINDGGALSFDANTEDYTVSLWFSTPTLDMPLDAGNYSGHILSDRSATDNVQMSYDFQVYGQSQPNPTNALAVSTWDGGSCCESPITASGFVETDKWYNAVYSVEGQVAKLYINGALQDTKDLSGALAGSTKNTEGTTIGRFAGAFFGHYWPGKVDEIRIYNRTLSAVEVSQLHEKDAPVFSLLQNVATHYAHHWEYFAVEGVPYLAVANFDN
ncbi:MAG: LamG-like jellyroll fold domain-containing protein [Thermodesulfobacteriota bacterium]